MMKLRNVTTGEVVASSVLRAGKPYAHLLGAIRPKQLNTNEGVWFDDCCVLHTIGMENEIDVIFLDKHQRVLRILCSVPRNRFPVACLAARSVVQLGSRELYNFDILVGDRFALED